MGTDNAIGTITGITIQPRATVMVIRTVADTTTVIPVGTVASAIMDIVRIGTTIRAPTDVPANTSDDKHGVGLAMSLCLNLNESGADSCRHPGPRSAQIEPGVGVINSNTSPVDCLGLPHSQLYATN